MSSSTSRKHAVFITCLILLWYSTNIGVLLLNKFLLSNYALPSPSFSQCATCQPVLSSATSPLCCGSNHTIFTALFAYLMTRKREAWLLILVLYLWLLGLSLQVGATAARAFKSVLQGVLLSSEGEKLNSMNLMLYMAPIAVVVLLPAALVMEPNVLDVVVSLGIEHKFMWILLFINSTMAYGANLCNFLVTKHTSALTLQVLGNAKGAVAVVISILISETLLPSWYCWLYHDCHGGGCLWRIQEEIQMSFHGAIVYAGTMGREGTGGRFIRQCFLY
ncbi:hypothetical protein Pfo_028356 [Paulownia fortunei]|nr:hypothetical protein Pfo_028356 [Paulownia fortunei]